jgi:hypothetical protein
VLEEAGVEFTNGDAPGVRLRKKKQRDRAVIARSSCDEAIQFYLCITEWMLDRRSLERMKP